MIYPSYTAAAPASPPSAGQAVRGTANRPAAYPECGGKIQRPNIKKNIKYGKYHPVMGNISSGKFIHTGNRNDMYIYIYIITIYSNG
jgi:hypothetical protein